MHNLEPYREPKIGIRHHATALYIEFPKNALAVIAAMSAKLPTVFVMPTLSVLCERSHKLRQKLTVAS